MHEPQQLDNKDRKRLLSDQTRFWIFAGLGVIIVGIVAPFFTWYVLMHATCGLSNDLCGMSVGIIVLFFSLPCGLLGVVTILVAVFRRNRK